MKEKEEIRNVGLEIEMMRALKFKEESIKFFISQKIFVIWIHELSKRNLSEVLASMELYTKKAHLLIGMFSWSETLSGYNYWDRLYNACYGINYAGTETPTNTDIPEERHIHLGDGLLDAIEDPIAMTEREANSPFRQSTRSPHYNGSMGQLSNDLYNNSSNSDRIGMVSLGSSQHSVREVAQSMDIQWI